MEKSQDTFKKSKSCYHIDSKFRRLIYSDNKSVFCNSVIKKALSLTEIVNFKNSVKLRDRGKTRCSVDYKINGNIDYKTSGNIDYMTTPVNLDRHLSNLSKSVDLQINRAFTKSKPIDYISLNRYALSDKIYFNLKQRKLLKTKYKFDCKKVNQS